MLNDDAQDDAELAAAIVELRRHVNHGLVIAVLAAFMLGASATLIIVQVLVRPWPAMPLDTIPLFTLTVVAVLVLVVHIAYGGPVLRPRRRQRTHSLSRPMVDSDPAD